jgi:hypothetical protein
MKTLLYAYLEKCKARHALAFIQYRRELKDAKLYELEEIFEERKKIAQNTFKVVRKLN